MEEQLRARRAADAAKAIGLDMDFGASGGEEDSELEEDEEELRRRLRSVRKRLRQRDKGESISNKHDYTIADASKNYLWLPKWLIKLYDNTSKSSLSFRLLLNHISPNF